MRKTFLCVALCAFCLALSAQSLQPTDEMMRQFRTSVQKRDISHYRNPNIPLSNQLQPQPKSAKAMPDGRVWFPGEWEEVQAIAVTAPYNHMPASTQGSGYWTADPMVTGVAQYYRYSAGRWMEQGMGPYISIMDTTSDFGDVFFYIMDAIQLGGAQAWVRIEKAADSAVVHRKLQRMNLRHNNLRFIIGPGNSIWFRDCGPICFYFGDNDQLAMLDFTYYPGRALDDSLPTLISQQYGLPNYISHIEWEGGNCLVDGTGMVFSSDAIYSKNADSYGQLTWDGVNTSSINYSQVSPLTRSQVRQALHDLIGQRATHILPAYQFDGGTGHVDLYADAWDENGFVFSIMPDIYSSWTDYSTGLRNIDSLCSFSSLFDRNYYIMGHIPFPSADNGNNFSSQTIYDRNYTRTYSNHTFVNNVIIQPCFSRVVNGQPSAEWDRQNIEALKAAYPGYTIYPVDVRQFDGSGGAIHCITKQIPADNPVRILHKNLHGSIRLASLDSIPVSAIITNQSGIAHAELLWRLADSSNWNTISLSPNGNRFSGNMPIVENGDSLHHVLYYISATSNNGKTITKPMTASQGGYYSFDYSQGGSIDSSNFDFQTDPVDIRDITFLFGESWAVEDTTPVRQLPNVAIHSADIEQAFGQFFPNPASAHAFIDINLGDGQRFDVSIIDANGRTVHTSELLSAGHIRFAIDAGRLPKGIFSVVFQSRDQRIVRRLVVN